MAIYESLLNFETEGRKELVTQYPALDGGWNGNSFKKFDCFDNSMLYALGP